jgi:predicted secreted Zn-dependent protease
MPVYNLAPGDLNWHAPRCDSGACVRVARHGDLVVFGNTTEPEGPVIAYTKAEWDAFLTGVKCGDFDDLG